MPTIHVDHVSIVHNDDCTITVHSPDFHDGSSLLPRPAWEELQRRRASAYEAHTETCLVGVAITVEHADTRGRSYLVERFE